MPETPANELEEIRGLINALDFEIVATAEGYKSSEGDGRTAADIEREIEEREKQWASQSTPAT